MNRDNQNENVNNQEEQDIVVEKKEARTSWFKRLKRWQKGLIIAAVILIPLWMIGSSSDSSDESDYDSNSQERLSQEEVQAEMDEVIIGEDNKKTEVEYLRNTGLALFEFIGETSTKMGEYAQNNDALALIAYATGLTDSETKAQIEESFALGKTYLKSDEALAIHEDIYTIYSNYMAVALLASEGKFGDASVDLINKVSEDIKRVTNDIMQFAKE